MLHGPVDVAVSEAAYGVSKIFLSNGGARGIHEGKYVVGGLGRNCVPATERSSTGKVIPLVGTAHPSQVHGVLRLRGGVRKQGKASFEFTGAGGERVSVGGDGEVQGGTKVRTCTHAKAPTFTLPHTILFIEYLVLGWALDIQESMHARNSSERAIERNSMQNLKNPIHVLPHVLFKL
jgi:hypothetical protein